MGETRLNPKDPLPSHIFSAKNIRILNIETAKTVNEMTLNELVKLTTLWTTGPRMTSWETRWDMFNPSKCQVVQVTGSRRPLNTTYTLHGQVLETVICAKHFGVDLSGGLSLNPYIDHLAGNANRTFGFIRRNKKTKMPKVGGEAYNTLVRPQLEYASVECVGSTHCWTYLSDWTGPAESCSLDRERPV